MSESLDEHIFDLAFRILNYAIEFVNTGDYSTLRLMDVLGSYLGIALQLEVGKKEFYEKVKEILDSRESLLSTEDKKRFLNVLLTMFIDEWRN